MNNVQTMYKNAEDYIITKTKKGFTYNRYVHPLLFEVMVEFVNMYDGYPVLFT